MGNGSLSFVPLVLEKYIYGGKFVLRLMAFRQILTMDVFHFKENKFKSLVCIMILNRVSVEYMNTFYRFYYNY